MRWSDVVEFPVVTTTYDKYHAPVYAETWRNVFANRKSIRQSEFYQSFSAGLKTEWMFEVREAEYNQESRLRYNNDIYYIIRTFSKNGEILELVCSRFPPPGG